MWGHGERSRVQALLCRCSTRKEIRRGGGGGGARRGAREGEEGIRGLFLYRGRPCLSLPRRVRKSGRVNWTGLPADSGFPRAQPVGASCLVCMCGCVDVGVCCFGCVMLEGCCRGSPARLWESSGPLRGQENRRITDLFRLFCAAEAAGGGGEVVGEISLLPSLRYTTRPRHATKSFSGVNTLIDATNW